MKISSKIALYTGMMTLAVGVIIIAYFLVLLPGLYVDYRQKEELANVAMVQDSYVKGLPMAKMEEELLLPVFVLTLPKEGNMIGVDSPFGAILLKLTDERLQNIIGEIQKDLKTIDYEERYETLSEIDFEKYAVFFKELVDENEAEGMVKIIDVTESKWTGETMSTEQMYQTPDGSIIFHTTVDLYGNQYTNYFGIAEGEKNYYFTVASTVSPKLRELSPILFQSAPMIIMILLLFTLCIAYIFSRVLAKPIELLAKEATRMKELDDVEPIQLGRKDEFHDLEVALNQLYTHLKGLLVQEKEMNALLKKEHESQELFMMNSSHQLKTPISAALLLVESMINKIGKYKDVDTYLPLVKQELMQMQQIVYDVLDVFKNMHRSVNLEVVDVGEIMETLIGHYQILLKERGIKLITELTTCKKNSDAEMLYAMLDNIVSNALRYTPKGERIQVVLNDAGFCVENSGIEIEEKIMERIFDPFVSFSKEEKSGHGLGLYLVSIYSKMLHIDLTIRNGKNCVIVEGRFDENAGN